MEHLSHFVEAAEGKQHQDGFGLVVDLRGAEVLGPALQHIGALCRAQPHLGKDACDVHGTESTNSLVDLWKDIIKMRKS